MEASFGDRLRQLRKQRNLTQEQLAEIIGVERSSIGKYEGKKQVIPSDEVKEKIADFFSVSLDYLCGRNPDAEKGKDYFLSSDEHRLLRCYRAMSPEGKEKVQSYVSDISVLYSSEKSQAIPASSSLK